MPCKTQRVVSPTTSRLRHSRRTELAPLHAAELNAALVLVEKYVSSREQRFIANAMRLLPVLRRKVQAGPAKSVPTLVDTVSQALAPSNPEAKTLQAKLVQLPPTPCA